MAELLATFGCSPSAPRVVSTSLRNHRSSGNSQDPSEGSWAPRGGPQGVLVGVNLAQADTSVGTSICDVCKTLKRVNCCWGLRGAGQRALRRGRSHGKRGAYPPRRRWKQTAGPFIHYNTPSIRWIRWIYGSFLLVGSRKHMMVGPPGLVINACPAPLAGPYCRAY